MSLHRDFEGPDGVRDTPVGRMAGTQEERRVTRTWRMAQGTLACPQCDAPVAPVGGPMSPADPLACPYCAHEGAVRDFLSLGAPTRPAHVDVRIVAPAWWR
jgi:hypothetical protein